MPVRIILDHPRRRDWRRIVETGRVLLGRLLVLIAVVAWPAGVVATLIVANRLGYNLDPELPGEVLAELFALVLVGVVLGVPWVLFRLGRLLARRPPNIGRRLVLFLRRFRLPEATSAVTFAISETLGRRWRLITLDDGSVRPIGAPSAIRGTLRSVALVHSFVDHGFAVLRVLRRVVYSYCKIAIAGVVSILTIQFVVERNFTPYREFIDRTASGAPLADLVGPDLPGLFATLLLPAAIVVEWATPSALVIWSGAAPVAQSLSDRDATIYLVGAIAVWIIATLTWDWIGTSTPTLSVMRRTETLMIGTADEVETAITWAGRGSEWRFGPKLAIARVDGSAWQLAVSRFGSTAALTIVDVSDPSDHVLWEIEELLIRQGRPCIFIGHHDRVSQFAHEDAALDDLDRRLVRLLDEQEILAYTMNRHGLRRFSRALKNGMDYRVANLVRSAG